MDNDQKAKVEQLIDGPLCPSTIYRLLRNHNAEVARLSGIIEQRDITIAKMAGAIRAKDVMIAAYINNQAVVNGMIESICRVLKTFKK